MASFATNRPKPAVSNEVSAVTPGEGATPLLAATSAAATPELTKPVPMATVRETMAVVLSAVEALASRADRAQSTVDLNFQVGTEKLGLHLALRDGMVYTVFRTDSAELRTTLGQEWQAVVPAMTTREGSVAAPVFAPSSPSAADSAANSPGQGHSQPRGHQPSETPHLYPQRPAATVSVSPTATAPVATPVAATSLLHAFA